ncbi:hypothetical protein HYFRA_00011920 [Hymenoscyphus fraxineus]|uniref:Hypersensitive response-inducing protein n=1 Tax=Hymenoscyphus fraxineus TaxID=746836 RepID=A0A9N9KZA0_9HELO|nr:hypothetical protein HYFRA_00011920 [Hymenoscyphus fraxineus]
MHFSLLTTATFLSFSAVAVATPQIVGPGTEHLPIRNKYVWFASNYKASCLKNDAPLEKCTYSYNIIGDEATGGASIVPAFNATCSATNVSPNDPQVPCEFNDNGPAGRSLNSSLIPALRPDATGSIQMQVSYQFVDQGDKTTSYKYIGDVRAPFAFDYFDIMTGEVIKLGNVN